MRDPRLRLLQKLAAVPTGPRDVLPSDEEVYDTLTDPRKIVDRLPLPVVNPKRSDPEYETYAGKYWKELLGLELAPLVARYATGRPTGLSPAAYHNLMEAAKISGSPIRPKDVEDISTGGRFHPAAPSRPSGRADYRNVGRVFMEEFPLIPALWNNVAGPAGLKRFEEEGLDQAGRKIRLDPRWGSAEALAKSLGQTLPGGRLSKVLRGLAGARLYGAAGALGVSAFSDDPSKELYAAGLASVPFAAHMVNEGRGVANAWKLMNQANSRMPAASKFGMRSKLGLLAGIPSAATASLLPWAGAVFKPRRRPGVEYETPKGVFNKIVEFLGTPGGAIAGGAVGSAALLASLALLSSGKEGPVDAQKSG